MQSISLSRTLAYLTIVLGMGHFARGQAPPEPTTEHQQLAREAGIWDAQMTMWVAPGVEPIEQTAVETNHMFGRFWLHSEFQCEGAFAFTGNMKLGYDPVRKKYVGMWTDTMSPYWSLSEGTYDKQTHTLTLVAEGRDWQTGEPQTSTMVSHYTSQNTKTFTMYAGAPAADGKPAADAWKMMEIKYQRRE